MPVAATFKAPLNLQVHEALSSFGSLHLEGRITESAWKILQRFMEASLICQILRPGNVEMRNEGFLGNASVFSQVEGLPSARLHSPNDVFCEAHMQLPFGATMPPTFRLKSVFAWLSGDIWLQCGDEDTSPDLDLLIWCEVFSFTW